MDAEKSNQALYEKMSTEQDEFRDWLLTLTPEEILNHAYAYAIREDILMEMEELDLPEKAAAALLESTTPLADVFEDFRNRDGHMDHVRECIEDLASSLLESKRDFTRIIPVYMGTAEYAKEHDESEVWQISHKTNIACKDAIETAIREGFDGMHLTADAKDVLAEFGPERVSFVLAHTLQTKAYDGRFSPSNLAWAKTIPIAESGVYRYQYAISSHPTLLNGFVDMARQAMERMKQPQQRKPSIKEQLSAGPAPSAQPDKPKDKGAR